MLKPKMTKSGFKAFLIEKGISVDATSDNYIIERGFEHNYIYKLLCYRDNYEKNEDNKYVGLKLNDLVELSHIDTHLRYTLLNLALDLEHIIRCKLLEAIADNEAIDGYKIVDEYFKYLGILKRRPEVDSVSKISNDEERKAAHKKIKTIPEYTEVERTRFLKPLEVGKYSKARYLKYRDAVPIWMIIDAFSMGELARFSRFYNVKYCTGEDSVFKDFGKNLSNAKNIRNLAAHNQPILVNIRIDNPDNQLEGPTETVSLYVRQLSKRNKDIVISNKWDVVKNQRVHDMITLLALYEKYCPDNQYKNLRKTQLSSIKDLLDNLDTSSMSRKMQCTFEVFALLFGNFAT